MAFRFLAIVPSFLALAVSLGSVAQASLPREKDVWLRVETPNFTLIGNVSERQIVEAGDRIERFREVLTRTTKGLSNRSPLPTTIYLFRNTASYEPYKLGRNGKPMSVSGYFAPSEHGNYVTMDASGATTPWPVIFHEYIHYVIDNNIPEAPVWVNEGLAEFYSTLHAPGGQTRAEIGRPIAEHVLELRRAELLPLDRLFAIDTRSPEYNESLRQGTFYAQCWAITHWLIVGDDDRRARFMEFLERVRRGEEPLGAFRTAVGIDAAALEKEIRKYARSDAFGIFWFKFDEAFAERTYQATPISRAEALFRLGDLLAHREPVRTADAEEHLQAALALEPDHVGARLALAWLDERSERWDAAIERYDGLVETGGATARTRYGWMLLRRAVAEATGAEVELPAKVRRARELFRGALALAPDDALALAGLGKSFFFGTDDPAEGIAALARARDLMPSRLEILGDLIGLLATAGRVDEAGTLLDRGLRGRTTDAETVGFAEESLALGAGRYAASRLKAGDGAGALAVLRKALEMAKGATTRTRIEEQIASFAAYAAKGAHIARYNEGVAAAGRGEAAVALKIFEQVATEATDPELRDAALAAARRVGAVVVHNRVLDRYRAAADLAKANDVKGAVRALEAILSEETDMEDEDRARVAATLDELRKAR